MFVRLATLAAAAWLLVACAETGAPSPASDGCATPSSTPRGFGISPRGMSLSGGPDDPEALEAFYDEVAAIEDGAVLWNGAWRGDAVNGTDAGTPPAAARAVVARAARDCFTPVLVFGWRAGATPLIQLPANTTNDWTNAEARERFTSMLATFARETEPPLLFLGNESDFYFEQAPADYARWIEVYDAAYEAIKAASPETQVGPVFNYEHLAGVGNLNGWTAPHWGALDGHDLAKVDVVGLSLYPFFNVREASALPADYLAPLFARIGAKPVAITETGWPAERLGGPELPWAASPQQQLDYVVRLETVLAGHEVRLMNWLLLHPLRDDGTNATAWRLFGSVSLRDTAGEPRSAYGAWTAR